MAREGLGLSQCWDPSSEVLPAGREVANCDVLDGQIYTKSRTKLMVSPLRLDQAMQTGVRHILVVGVGTKLLLGDEDPTFDF